jgi:large subunit ribosomal protein L35
MTTWGSFVALSSISFPQCSKNENRCEDFLEPAAAHAHQRSTITTGDTAKGNAAAAEKICYRAALNYLPRLMPKSIARSKTRKAVAKRFKITARGKVLRSQSSRRHLLSSKNAKRRRQLGKSVLVDKTDVARIKANLPFG